jgi:hypothetical protein
MTDFAVREVLEHLTDVWNDAIHSDLEHGVGFLNALASVEFHRKYPAVSAFGEHLHDLYMEQLND